MNDVHAEANIAELRERIELLERQIAALAELVYGGKRIIEAERGDESQTFDEIMTAAVRQREREARLNRKIQSLEEDIKLANEEIRRFELDK